RKLTDLKNKELNSKAPAIICSIHQPSARVLNIFHQIYVLSFDGRCVYSGPPSQLIDYLSKLGLQCPQFHNPADFIIEIASSDYGTEAVNKLAISECNRQVDYLNEEKMLLSCTKFLISTNGSKQRNCIRVPVSKVIARLKNKSFPHFKHTWLLLRRTYLSTIRDPKLTWFRISQAIFIAMLMSYLYDYPIGRADGCLPVTAISDQNAFMSIGVGTQDNISFIFFVILFTVMASRMPTVLTFPSEVSVLIQERNNGWYSCWVYYWTKVIADSPYQILITLMFCSIIYPMTSQIESYTRFALFNVIMILVASIAQCVGMLFGTLYVHSVENAVFMAPLSMAPMFLLSGFFGKLSAIPIVMKPIAYISYVKYAFEAILVVLYGMNRCPTFDELKIAAINARLPTNANIVRKNIQDNRQMRINEQYAQSFPKVWSGYYNPLTYQLNHSMVHETTTNATTRSINSTSTSLILRHFEVIDDTLIENICILVFILILLRFVTYFILLSKSNKKK
ncbi:ABC transporter-like protein 12, partial [Leptotrombidium deliense]